MCVKDLTLSVSTVLPQCRYSVTSVSVQCYFVMFSYICQCLILKRRSFFDVLGEPFYEESQVVCPNAIQLQPEPPSHSQSPSNNNSASAVRRSISSKPGTKRLLPFSPEVIHF